MTRNRLTMSANVPSAQTGVNMATWRNGTPNGISTDPNPRNRRDDPDERDEERPDVQRAPGRRQLQREREQNLAGPERRALPERHARELVLVLPAREEPVRVRRVVREQALQVFEREIARVGGEQLARAIRSGALHGSVSRLSVVCPVPAVSLAYMTSDLLNGAIGGYGGNEDISHGGTESRRHGEKLGIHSVPPCLRSSVFGCFVISVPSATCALLNPKWIRREKAPVRLSQTYPARTAGRRGCGWR